ncbi:adenosine receptor A3-like [Exaiptasia diaphana]|uniref:G-protein coupled receptors family 1 profile domain-containing protein n=1 Tax=Exaiptasia diaphana TaxID=2652724 RepID=A0A913YCT2_EXADI|nr:adenosine receptor A3-like [Exaiptasia diaphana]
MNNSSTTIEEQPETADARFIVSMIVINAFSGLLATVLNLLIIATFIKTPSLRTPSNILILSLAIADFGVGAFAEPSYSLVLLVNTSAVTITAITVDRFLALHLHLRYQELVTTKRISVVIPYGAVAGTVVETILFMNSSINPIIYFWRIEDMRNDALQLLGSLRRRNNGTNDTGSSS